MGGLLTTLALPTGYPYEAGLVAYWDMMVDNLLLYPQEFSNASWTKTRSYIAANCAADPVSGAYTVDKLVEDGTATNNHYVIQSPTLVAGTYTVGWLVKAAGRTWVRVTMVATHAFINLTTGAVGTTSGLDATPVPVDMGGGWWLIPAVDTVGAGVVDCWLAIAEADNDVVINGTGHQGTAVVGGSTTTAVLAAGASAVDDVYNGTDTMVFSDAPTVWHTVTDYVGATKTATFTPARASAPDGTTYTVGPGILIARAQLNPGTSLRDYQVNTDLQSLASLYSKSPTLQRGATSGAEASDGALVATGWQAVTDDYLLSGNLSGVTMAGDWTAFVVGLFNGASNLVWFLGTSANDTNYFGADYTAANTVRARSTDATTTAATTGVAMSATSVVCVVIKQAGGVLSIKRMDTGTTASVTARVPVGTARYALAGRIHSSPGAIADAMTASLGSFHNVALSTAQIQRAYRALKARAAVKGVNVL